MLLESKGFVRIKGLKDAVEAVYSADEAKRRFEILARQVFIRFRALLMEAGASANHFSTVVPIADINGDIIEDRQSEFPNRGRAWWMLRGEAR